MIRQGVYLLPFLAALLLAAGCLSPLDTDTPRLRYEDQAVVPPPAHARIHARYFVVTARDVTTQTDWKVVLADTLVEIDTTVHPVAVWIKAAVGREINSQAPATPFVYDFRIRIDSLIASGKVMNLAGEPALPGGALITLATERDTTGAPRKTVLYANSDGNTVTLKLEEVNGTQGLIAGVLAINLTTHRLQVEAKLTIRY
jgi:hypothetical protein